MKEDHEPLVYFVEHPDSQIVQVFEDALVPSARAGTSRRAIFLGLLVDLGACLASTSAIRTPAVVSQILHLALGTGGLTHGGKERLSGFPAVRFPTMSAETQQSRQDWSAHRGQSAFTKGAYPNSHFTSMSRCKDSMSAKMYLHCSLNEAVCALAKHWCSGSTYQWQALHVKYPHRWSSRLRSNT